VESGPGSWGEKGDTQQIHSPKRRDGLMAGNVCLTAERAVSAPAESRGGDAQGAPVAKRRAAETPSRVPRSLGSGPMTRRRARNRVPHYPTWFDVRPSSGQRLTVVTNRRPQMIREHCQVPGATGQQTQPLFSSEVTAGGLPPSGTAAAEAHSAGGK
jgi:hypothetical protein